MAFGHSIDFRRRAQLALAASAALLVAGCGGAKTEAAAEGGAVTDGGGLAAASEETAKSGAFAEMAIGDENAAVTVIEYSSLTCPHCATFHESILPDIKRDYVDTGKVRFVFREFPTAPAHLAVAGSMLARCAADKGGVDAYVLVSEALFKKQRAWITSNDPRDELIKVAGQAGMDEEAFQSCIERKELLDHINETITEGRDTYQITSTPSFVVDGAVRHPNSVEDFSKILDEALEKADKKSG